MVEHNDDWILFRLQRLSPRRFEELCLALLAAEGHLEVRHLGASGSDRGVDLLSIGPDGRWWVTQCKRYQKIGPADVTMEIQKVIDEPPEPLPAFYRLAATCDVSRETEKVLREKARLAPFSLEVAGSWAASELVAMLRDKHPHLREEFIRPDEEAGTSPLYGVPDTRSVVFVGREAELGQVEAILQRGGSVRIAASIEGLPGIGKTELALQLVHQLALGGAFPGGIFWFNAEDADLQPTWGGPMADALGVAPGPAQERAAQALRTVSQLGAPVLLVLDNVEAWNADRQPAPLPQGAHLRYLVTTRQRFLGGAQFEAVSVGILGAAFARQLLDAVSGRELAAAPGHGALLDYLDGHALALELAGAFLKEFHWETPASYLAALRAGSEVEGEVSDHVRYQHTVTQAFQTLWARLEEESHDAWRLAACSEPELVSPELSEAVGLDRKPLGRLSRLHLLEVDDAGRWWMHRLTREFGRRVGSEAELAAARQVFVQGCAAFADQIEPDTGFRPYLANRSHLDAAVRLTPEVLNPQRTSELQNRIGIGRQSAGDLVGARKLFEQALATAIENLGEDHPKVAIRRSNLAMVLKDLGDLQGAKELLQLVLAADIENHGEDHPDVAIRRSNLAVVLKDLGDLPAAQAMARKALEIAALQPEGSYVRTRIEAAMRKLLPDGDA